MAAARAKSYQLVLQLSADGADDLDKVAELEETLADSLDDDCEVDDTDVAGDSAVISISTNDAEAAFDDALQIIEKQDDLELTAAAYRPISGGEFTVLFPEDYDGEFELP